MNDSIFKLINKQLRRFSCIQQYQGANDNPATSTLEHIGSSCMFALLPNIAITYSPWFAFITLCLWIYYAPFKEFVLDRHKNAGSPKALVYAQVLERSSGFVVCLPLTILAMFV